MLDTPAGLVAVQAEVQRGTVKRVIFENVPARGEILFGSAK